MLQSTCVEVSLVVFAVFGKEIIPNCYDDYQRCIPEGNETNYANVEEIGSHNIIEFCFTHTHNILPCLATKLGMKKGMSVTTFSLLLALCDVKAENNKSTATAEVEQSLKHLARLYAYFCAYSNILDLHHNTECFRNLMKQCVLKKPNESCMFYHCEKVSLNLSKPHSSTQQHKLTKAISLTTYHHDKSSIVMNHQSRITPAITATLITAFLGCTIQLFIGVRK